MTENPMMRAYLRILRISLIAASFLPAIVILCSSLIGDPGWPTNQRAIAVIAALAAGGAICVFVNKLIHQHASSIEFEAAEQYRLLDTWPTERWISLGIVGSAAMSLFLELAVIRWQGTVSELFAFYKNLGLLACFAGIGIGYALSSARAIPLLCTIPLLAFQIGMLLFLKHGVSPAQRISLHGLPFSEQLHMGLQAVKNVWGFIAVYAYLTIVFLLTALTFLPVGQLCGKLMERRPPLKAYGLNLFGSLLGVSIMFLVSFLWTPPIVWFAVAFVTIIAFQAAYPRPLLTGFLATAIAMICLSWPVSVGWEQIYSPYQLLERGPGENGLMNIRSAGHYLLRVLDLSDSKAAAKSDDIRHLRMKGYYELPFKLQKKSISEVLIVGAGAGNDVAAALRRVGRDRTVDEFRIDAVEIDPAITMLGRMYHPETPYQDPHVRVIVDDARTYIQKTDKTYDMIVYGLLDSHTLLSHGSSVRLDSFVYTTEALKDAVSKLKPGGTLSLSFSVLSDELGRKIFLMMKEAFGGTDPRCIVTHYDASVMFIQRKDTPIELPLDDLKKSGFDDVSSYYANPNLTADMSTDDWPFFYMPHRTFPLSYVGMGVLIIALSLLLIVYFFPQRPGTTDGSFFFLGIGFMLIETKGITELGLCFGNTWQVIGLVIIGVLLFAFLANLIVARTKFKQPTIAFGLLFVSLALGLWMSIGSGLSTTGAGRYAKLFLLTCPVFFSGIAFSTLFGQAASMSRAMAANIFGALCGGLLEYNSMYFGFRSLYWLAAGIYILAFVCTLMLEKPKAATSLIDS